MKDKDLSQITTYQAGAVQAAMHRTLQKQCDFILKPFGITKMHWLIIGTVLDAGKAGIRISDLAKALGTTIPYLTTTINLLESKGILMREDNDNDSRSKLIALNPNYIKQCHKIEEKLREELRTTIYSAVDPHEFFIYMKVMHQLMNVSK